MSLLDCKYLFKKNNKKFCSLRNNCFVDKNLIVCINCEEKKIKEKIEKSKNPIKYAIKKVKKEKSIENIINETIYKESFKNTKKISFRTCKFFVKERRDVPHKGPCCFPIECKHEKIKEMMDGVVLISMCNNCKFFEFNETPNHPDDQNKVE